MSNARSSARAAFFVVSAFLLLRCGRQTADINGTWNATIVSGGAPIPFRLDLASDGHQARGFFFDGDRKIPSTSGKLDGNQLHLHFDLYNSDLDALIDHDTLRGNYVVQKRKKEPSRPITAKRATEPNSTTGPSANIAGDWELRARNGDPAVAGKMVVQQNGSDIHAAVLRLDGDTGALTGNFRNNQLVISHFSGARPALFEGSLQPDGTLALLLDRKTPMIGIRATDANAQKLSAKPDPFHATTVKDPDEPFHFSAPDADGHTISASDPQFHGKPFIVSIGGTWCPNCMDEAPFLVELYNQYHAQGLEIVGLNFESGDMPYDRARVKSFVARYGIPYPVLIAGATDKAASELPQLVNFSAFPTTIFVGRDGRVKGIHDGFASVATGQEHVKLKLETDAFVQRLLKE